MKMRLLSKCPPKIEVSGVLYYKLAHYIIEHHCHKLSQMLVTINILPVKWFKHYIIYNILYMLMFLQTVFTAFFLCVYLRVMYFNVAACTVIYKFYYFVFHSPAHVVSMSDY